MKKILFSGVCAAALCGSAFAADMARPVYKAAPAVAPTFSWTGCYVGGNVGWGRSKATASGVVTTTSGSTFAFGAKRSASGFVGGGQLGCDYQAGNVVFGIEGMWDGTDIRKSLDTLGVITTSKLPSFETLTGRIGWAMDRSLLYVKGGGAWTQTKQGLDATAVGGAIDNVSKDINGWDLGVGWEYAFAPNWSAKIEYNYMRFSNTSIFFPNNAVTAQFTNQSLQTILVGLNYRFDWGKSPVVAKY
jgi:outer membrane immunogenic protein